MHNCKSGQLITGPWFTRWPPHHPSICSWEWVSPITALLHTILPYAAGSGCRQLQPSQHGADAQSIQYSDKLVSTRLALEVTFGSYKFIASIASGRLAVSLCLVGSRWGKSHSGMALLVDPMGICRFWVFSRLTFVVLLLKTRLHFNCFLKSRPTTWLRPCSCNPL